MQIVVNGEPQDAPDLLSVADLIARLGYAGQRLAVELNGAILPRAEWPARALRAADRVELVRAIGGG